MTHPLLVAAVQAELGELPGECLGVGPLRAAARMASLLARVQPTRVLLVGSAGAYTQRLPIGTAVVANQLGFVDSAAVAGLAYMPLPPEPIGPGRHLFPEDVPTARVLTSASITTDMALVRRHAQAWDVEHMEAYGAALACQDAGVPFAVVLGIANRVGPDAHAEWLAHREEAERAAQAVAQHWLVAGGQEMAERPDPTG